MVVEGIEQKSLIGVNCFDIYIYILCILCKIPSVCQYLWEKTDLCSSCLATACLLHSLWECQTERKHQSSRECQMFRRHISECIHSVGHSSVSQTRVRTTWWALSPSLCPRIRMSVSQHFLVIPLLLMLPLGPVTRQHLHKWQSVNSSYNTLAFV